MVLNSRLILAVAVILPGVGHVLAGRPGRGLGFAFFTLVFAWLTTKYAAPDASFIGRYAGGFFVWALSIPDAYRIARLREARAATAGSNRTQPDAASPADR